MFFYFTGPGGNVKFFFSRDPLMHGKDPQRMDNIPPVKKGIAAGPAATSLFSSKFRGGGGVMR